MGSQLTASKFPQQSSRHLDSVTNSRPDFLACLLVLAPAQDVTYLNRTYCAERQQLERYQQMYDFSTNSVTNGNRGASSFMDTRKSWYRQEKGCQHHPGCQQLQGYQQKRVAAGEGHQQQQGRQQLQTRQKQGEHQIQRYMKYPGMLSIYI